MKISIFLLLVIALSTLTHSQKFVQKPCLSYDEAILEQPKIQNAHRNEWTVIWSETFDSTQWHTANDNGVAVPENMPNGWTAVDNTGNDFYWRWSVDGPRGKYTNASAWNQPNQAHRPNSTSDTDPNGENGFMLLESDFYNTSAEGQEIDPFVTMDTYIQSRAIDLSENPAVSMYFEQWHRFCCAAYSETAGPKLYVSNNGTDWVQYSVHKAAVNATPKVNPAIVELSITSVAAGQETVYLRFHQIGQSHYHWSVDDIYLLEPPQYNLWVHTYFADYYSTVRVSPYPGNIIPNDAKTSAIPYFVPYHSFQEIIGTDSHFSNHGLYPYTNFFQTISIQKSGNELMSDYTSPITVIVDSLYNQVKPLNYQIPKEVESIGEYRLIGNFEADQEIGSYARLPKEFDFNVTNNLYGYANPKYAHSDRHSPISYTGAVDGDGVGIVVLMDPSAETIPGSDVPAPHVLKGVNVHINNDGYNWDIWEAGNVANLMAEVYTGTYDGNDWTFDLENPLITSELCPIDSSFSGKWAFLPFAPQEGNEFVIPSAPATQYLVLIRFYTENLRFFIGADRFSAPNWFANWLVMGNDLAWTGSTTNIALELVVSPYGALTESSLQLSALYQNSGTSSTHPALGAVVTLYSNDNDMNMVATTQTVDESGMTTFTGLRSGSYKYSAEYLGYTQTGSVSAIGINTSKEILFNIVGIENQPLANTLKLYPNPAQNLLTVESVNEPKHIEIANLLGQTLKTVVNPAASQTIDISGLATGVYVVTVVDRGNGRTSKMFVKQ